MRISSSRRFAPLADDPGVQALIIDRTSTAIDDSLDVASFTNDLFDGIGSLGDLPPRARAALELLRAPAISGIQGLIDTGVSRVVQSDAFSAVWRTALVASHRALVATVTNDGTGAVVIDDSGAIGVQLGPIIEQVKQRLVDQGIGFAAAIPEIDRTIVIAQVDALVVVGTVYTLAAAVGWWLPFVAIGLLVVGILVARRRSAAVLGTGLAIAIAAAILAGALAGAGAVLALNAPSLGIPAATLSTIFTQVVGAMQDTALVLVFLGIVLAVAGWVAGRSRGAARTRALSGSLVTSARSGLYARGLRTGRFGGWLATQMVLVRLIIMVPRRASAHRPAAAVVRRHRLRGGARPRRLAGRRAAAGPVGGRCRGRG